MKYDIQLSTHFKLSEFTRSSTATARGIDNTPTLDVVSNLQQLCIHVLEPLRAFANQSSPLGGDKRGASYEDNRTAEQKVTVHELLMVLHEMFPKAKVVGHHDLNAMKACPCYDAKREYAYILKFDVR